MLENLTKLSYQTLQESKKIFSLSHKILSTRLQNLLYPSQEQIREYSPEAIAKLQQRSNQLLEIDWQDAQKGIYPESLLFENQWQDFFVYYSQLCLDLPAVWERKQEKKHQDFAPEINQQGYPSYYLQNFHHQTDGYLSDSSANLYDLQVEILFGGVADAMRRRILPPLKRELNQFQEQSQIRILDVACGTGRTLKFIRSALPKASLFGIDLSPAYLRKANQLLSQNPGELPQLLQANAEELPYVDNYFHAVTSVFLFHELPAPVRQKVIQECFRVLKPGGIFIICDSIQMIDSSEFVDMMNGFTKTFHEPYYKNYTTDNLIDRLEKVGFENIETQVHFLSKYLIAHKPI
jgi:ubiquinone/menaquinone biosynthesis C-methylase UbiE